MKIDPVLGHNTNQQIERNWYLSYILKLKNTSPNNLSKNITMDFSKYLKLNDNEKNISKMRRMKNNKKEVLEENI